MVHFFYSHFYLIVLSLLFIILNKLRHFITSSLSLDVFIVVFHDSP